MESLACLRVVVQTYSDQLVKENKRSQQCLLGYVSKHYEYELLKEFLCDLTYNAQLGFLSGQETRLYDSLSLAWSVTHLPTEYAALISASSAGKMKFDKDMAAVLISRLEDRIDQRLDVTSQQGCNERDTLLQLKKAKLDAEMKLYTIQCTFVETISQIYSLAFNLFREQRTEKQSRINMLIVTTLLEQAEALLAQVNNLDYSIRGVLLTSSSKFDNYRSIRASLLNTRSELTAEVKRLENALDIYTSRDAHYHELVERYKGCQRQISLRAELLSNEAPTGTAEHVVEKRMARRSLSADFVSHSHLT